MLGVPAPDRGETSFPLDEGQEPKRAPKKSRAAPIRAEAYNRADDHTRGFVVHFGVVRTFRRGLLVGFLAIIVGVVVRLRGKGGVTPTSGGWRELEGPDFR